MQAHKDGTLANNPDWEVPFMQRMSRMVLRDRNITARYKPYSLHNAYHS